MASHQPDDDRAARANQLYWESDRSVNRIAELLDLSKGTLYGMIRPLAAGLPCPRCTAAMEYLNRTARERGLLVCPDCGLEQGEEAVREAWSDAAARAPGGRLVVDAGEPRSASRAASASAAGAAGLAATGRDGPDPRGTPAGAAAVPHAIPDRALVGAGLLVAAAGFWLVRRLRRG